MPEQDAGAGPMPPAQDRTRSSGGQAWPVAQQLLAAIRAA
jgi:hypothetical protein